MTASAIQHNSCMKSFKASKWELRRRAREEKIAAARQAEIEAINAIDQRQDRSIALLAYKLRDVEDWPKAAFPQLLHAIVEAYILEVNSAEVLGFSGAGI